MKKANFSPIGSPIAVSPIGLPLGPNGSLVNQGPFYPPSPVGTSLRSPRGLNRPANRLSSEFNNGWESSDRPSWGSMGNLPSFVSLETDDGSSASMNGASYANGASPYPNGASGYSNGPSSFNGSMNGGPPSNFGYGAATPIGSAPRYNGDGASLMGTPTFGMITSLPSNGGVTLGSSNNTVARPIAPPLSPNNMSTPSNNNNNAILSISPSRTPTHLASNGAAFSDYDYYSRASGMNNGSGMTNGLGTPTQVNSPLPMQPANGMGGGNPKAFGSGTTSPAAVPLMKPAPLQRAGSAGGVLMHAPRRPPPSAVAPNMTNSNDSWSVPTPSNTHSSPQHYVKQTPTSYEQEPSASEDWFDQFGGMEMENSSASFGYDTIPADAQNSPQSYENSARSAMNSRYMPNQRGNFTSPRVALYSAQESMTPLSATPSHIAHSMQMGMSPQNASPISAGPNSPLATPAFSPIKHSSRILMLHNFDQLNLDVNSLRTLFSAQGVLRSVSPFPDSNAILISYFDLRHAQKAMATLSGKTLSNGALIELQYHFLRDFQAKDANQGTLVIFNLDPAITNGELAELFGKYGELKEIRESPNRKHKFVEFYDVRCAEKAIKALNKSDLHGRKIKIEPSRPGGTSKPENSFQKFDSSFSTMGRRGSLGSAMHNVNPIFTHSAPSLPSMTSAPYIGSAPGPSQNYVSFSPSAAPLLPSSGGYMQHPSQQRYDYPPTDEGSYYAESQYQMGPGAIMSHHHMVDRRNAIAMESAHGMNGVPAGMERMDDTFERSVLESALMPLSTPFNNEARSAFTEPSSTASLFGMESYSDVISETGPDPLQGLLLSPTSTPRSSVASGSSSSSDLGLIDGLAKTDDEFSQFIPLPMHPQGSNSNQRMNGMSNMIVGVSALNMNGVGGSSANSATSGGMMLVGGSNGLNLSGGASESGGMNGNGVNGNGGGSGQLRFDIIIPHVLGGLDTRTTLMIKNIPNKYDQDMLLLAVNKRHQGTYDFFYLPIDFKNRCNVGYAFINFIDPKSIPSFYEEFDNKKWEKFNSEKVCRISYARIQGKQSMIEHFKNSSLMFEDPKCRPLIFHSDGSAIGKPEPFPIGPNVRPRSRKDSAGSSSAPGVGVVGAVGGNGLPLPTSVSPSLPSSTPSSGPPTPNASNAAINTTSTLGAASPLAGQGASAASAGASIVSPIASPMASVNAGLNTNLNPGTATSPTYHLTQLMAATGGQNASTNSSPNSPTRPSPSSSSYKPKRDKNASPRSLNDH